MIFQSSCKHRIAVSFAFKQKRSQQFSVLPTIGVARGGAGGPIPPI